MLPVELASATLSLNTETWQWSAAPVWGFWIANFQRAVAVHVLALYWHTLIYNVLETFQFFLIPSIEINK